MVSAPMNVKALLRDVDVLSRHYWERHGLSQNSPDRCSCGAQTLPLPGDDDVSIRRARAFAGHQAEMLAKARGEDLP